MAHLAKSSAHVELPDKRLLKRPHLAILLGLVASEWANLENTLSFLYATLLGKYLPHNQRQGPPIHPIGLQIFETLENLNKRTQLLQKLSDTLITNESLILEMKKDLIPKIKKAGSLRATLVHAFWGINDTEYPDALLLVKAPGKFLVYEESDFNNTIDFIMATENAIYKFESKVRQHLRAARRPYREGFSGS